MTKPKIALQLWSIQEDCKTDLFEALKTVKQNGYDGVEFAGYHGHSAAQIKEMLEQLDLAVAASHIPFEALRDRFEETVTFEKTIGNQRIVIPYASFDSLEKWQAFAAELTQITQKLQAEGLTCY